MDFEGIINVFPIGGLREVKGTFCGKSCPLCPAGLGMVTPLVVFWGIGIFGRGKIGIPARELFFIGLL